MSEVLEVTTREKFGKLNNRRLRGQGLLPAVLYGHGKDPVSLSVPEDQFATTLRHGAHVVQLKGSATGQALLQEVQWDVFRQYVLHVDLLRVEAKDRITVTVPVAFRGMAPGENEGGVIEHMVHELEIETSPIAVPDSLHFNINNLHVGDVLKASDAEDLPAGAKILGDASRLVAQCVVPTEAPEVEESVAGTAAEPEVIGAKDDAEEGKEAS